MSNYTKTEDVQKRMNYSDRQFLRASDFLDEQKYQVNLRRQHNKFLHNYGIVKNEIIASKSGDTQLTITPGHAFDKGGREIILIGDPPDSTFKLDLTEQATKGTKFLLLTIAYNETYDEKDKVTEAGFSGYIRVWEKPLVKVTKTDKISLDSNKKIGSDGFDSNATNELLIAVVALTSTGKISAVYNDTPGRYTSGVKIGQVRNDDLEVGTITGDKIAGTTIDTVNLKDLSVTEGKLANNAVSSRVLVTADSGVDQNISLGNGIKTAHLKDQAITEAKIANNAISSRTLALADSGTDQSTSSGNGIKTNHIKNQAITETKIGPNAISSRVIASADGGVDQNILIGNGIKTSHIKDRAITNDKMSDTAVSSRVLALADSGTDQTTTSGNGVKTAHIKNQAVTETKLAASAVSSRVMAKADPGTDQTIATGCGVKTNHIKNHAVTADKIADGSLRMRHIDGLHKAIFPIFLPGQIESFFLESRTNRDYPFYFVNIHSENINAKFTWHIKQGDHNGPAWLMVVSNVGSVVANCEVWYLKTF